MTDVIPQGISNRGVISAVDADGTTHHYHTDPAESRQFALASMALAAGREELFLLLYSNDSPYHAKLRHADGRSVVELKRDWLDKVTACGLSLQAAEQFLEARLAC